MKHKFNYTTSLNKFPYHCLKRNWKQILIYLKDQDRQNRHQASDLQSVLTLITHFTLRLKKAMFALA